MTDKEFDPSEQLMREYRMAGGSAKVISDISHPKQQPTGTVPVLARWLSELESLWPSSEIGTRELAREILIHALSGRESRKTAAIPALIAQFDTHKH